MAREVYRYEFDDRIPADEIESTLLLAVIGVESLHSHAGVRLDARHIFDRERHTCVVDSDTPIGRAFNQLFTGYAAREFGEDAFQVRRIDHLPQAAPGKNGHSG